MSLKDLNPTGRFSDRVKDYVAYRPSYPSSLLDCLHLEAGLGKDTRIADIGSGTGIFTRLLLERGARVAAIEPNEAMRKAAEQDLREFPGFESRAGTAEATGLPPASVELITSAQAFHWFDPPKARAEFARILAPGGRVALIWNSVETKSSEFGREYDVLKARYATDLERVNKVTYQAEKYFPHFFLEGRYETRTFENFQIFDLDGLRGRLLSSSYAPKAGHPSFEPMIAALDELFDRFQKDGKVRMQYETELFLGRV